MRFYQQQHGFYCGVDLHTRTMHVCVVDANGVTREYVNFTSGSQARTQQPGCFRAAGLLPCARVLLCAGRLTAPGATGGLPASASDS